MIAAKTQTPHDTQGFVLLADKPCKKLDPIIIIFTEINNRIILEQANIVKLFIHNHNKVFKEKGNVYSAPLYKLSRFAIFLNNLSI